MDASSSDYAANELNEGLLLDAESPTPAPRERRGTAAQYWLGGTVGVVAVAALAVAIIAYGKQDATSQQAADTATAAHVNKMALQIHQAAATHPVCASSNSQFSDCHDLSVTMQRMIEANASSPSALVGALSSGSAVKGNVVPFIADRAAQTYSVHADNSFSPSHWDYLLDPSPSNCVHVFDGNWCLKFLVNGTTNATAIAVVQLPEGDSQVRTRRNPNGWTRADHALESAGTGAAIGSACFGPPGAAVGAAAGGAMGYCSQCGSGCYGGSNCR